MANNKFVIQIWRVNSFWISIVVHVFAALGFLTFIWTLKHPVLETTEIFVQDLKGAGTAQRKVFVPKVPRRSHLGQDHLKALEAPETVKVADSAESDVGWQNENRIQTYLFEIQKTIQGNKSFPRMSVLAHEEGRIELELRIDSMGKLLEVRIVQSSPFERLNEAALVAVQKSAPFPKTPFNQELLIHVPILFELH